MKQTTFITFVIIILCSCSCNNSILRLGSYNIRGNDENSGNCMQNLPKKLPIGFTISPKIQITSADTESVRILSGQQRQNTATLTLQSISQSRKKTQKPLRRQRQPSSPVIRSACCVWRTRAMPGI